MTRTSDAAHGLVMARRDETGRLVVDCSCGTAVRADSLPEAQQALTRHAADARERSRTA